MPDRPNILLIISDQQRTDTLGFRGLTPCKTPNMDRLAREGISFDRAITPSPLCLPARSAMFTGQYPHQTNMMDNDDSLSTESFLLTRMRDAGYCVDYAGKWHLGEDNIHQWTDRHAGDSTVAYSQWCHSRGIADGWAFNDPATRTHRTPHMSIPAASVSPIKPEETNDAWITDHAINFIRTRDRQQPFFLTCSFNGPHPPFRIPEPYYSMYAADDIPEPPNFHPSRLTGEPDSNRTSFYRTLWNDHGDQWNAWKKSVAVYWGFVSLIDAQVGRVIECLEAEGLYDDTFIIFASDHGEMLGQHGLWHKCHAYEESLRVPLIMRSPKNANADIRSQSGASLIDIGPTILGQCAFEIPDEIEGIDLSPAFTSDSNWSADRLLFSEHKPLGDWHHAVDWRMVTDNRFKYTWNRGDRDELYNLETDLHEMCNLIDDGKLANRVAAMRDQLHAWMRATADPLLGVYEADQSAVS